MIDRLMNIDRRIIFIFVFLGVAVPLLVSSKLPIKPTPTVRAVYDEIERVAGQDKPVLLSFAYGASTEPEMPPMARAILRHCFSRNLKVVAMCLWPDAVGLAQDVLQSVAKEYGKEYGTDYVFLGYKPGTYSVIVNMGQDLQNAFSQDNWGTPTGQLALTRDIRKLSDFGFVFDFGAGDSIEFWWIPYGQEKYRFPFAGGCTAVMAPDLYPFLQSGQLVGLLGGLAGAAEYETLVGYQGNATSGMQPQSVTHLIIILFIVLGNTMYFVAKRRGRLSPESRG